MSRQLEKETNEEKLKRYKEDYEEKLLRHEEDLDKKLQQEKKQYLEKLLRHEQELDRKLQNEKVNYQKKLQKKLLKLLEEEKAAEAWRGDTQIQKGNENGVYWHVEGWWKTIRTYRYRKPDIVIAYQFFKDDKQKKLWCFIIGDGCPLLSDVISWFGE